MSRFILKLTLAAALFGMMATFAQAQCYGGRCFAPAGPAPVIYQPRVVYQPWQYRGSSYTPRNYQTPFRTMLFGRGVWRHHYTPQVQR